MVVLFFFFFFFFFFDGESFSSKHCCCSSAVVGHVNGLHSKCNRQYSDCHLHMCSTQAVNSKDTVVNSLCVKYKSSQRVVDKGMWVSAV